METHIRYLCLTIFLNILKEPSLQGVSCSIKFDEFTKQEEYSCNLLEKCIVSLGQLIFPNNNYVTVVSDDKALEHEIAVIKSMNNELYVPLVIIRKMRGQKVEFDLDKTTPIGRCNIFVIFSAHESTMLANLEESKNLSIWKPESKFLYVVSKKDIPLRAVRTIFETSWKLKILNSIFIYIREYSSGSNKYPHFMVHNFNPFIGDYRGGNGSESLILDVDICQTCEHLSLPTELFPDKLKNLQGFTLKVRGFEKFPEVLYDPNSKPIGEQHVLKDGTDANILLVSAKYMNFSLFYRGSRVKNKNVKWNYLLEDVVYGESDIFLNSMALYLDDVLVVDYTILTGYLVISFAVPTSREVSFWELMVMAFDVNVWLLVLTSLLLTMTLFVFGVKLYENKETHIKNSSCLLYSLSIFLQISVRQPNTFVLRSIYILFAYFSLVMSCLYQKYFTQVLTVPPLYPEMTTLEDVAASGLPVRSYPFHYPIIRDSSNSAMQDMIKRYKSEGDVTKNIKRVAYQRDIVFYEPRIYIEYIITHQQLFKNGHPLIHIVEQPVLVHHLALCLTKNSPYTSKFNVVIRKIHESGIHVKWGQDLFYGLDLERKSSHKSSSDSNGSLCLSMNHMKPAFYILGCGVVLALVAVISELTLAHLFNT